MNQVVNFLSLLAVTEEQGGIKRMLGVCVEFERIAKVVLGKAENESHSKRKRKSTKETEETSLNFTETTTKPVAPPTPVSQTQRQSPSIFTPSVTGDTSNQEFNPNFNNFSPFSNGNLFAPLSLEGLPNSTSTTQSTLSEKDLQQISSEGVSSFDMGSFQQPFVPQDLWQIPQTLEWDWADLNNMGYPAFDRDSSYMPPPDGFSGPG